MEKPLYKVGDRVVEDISGVSFTITKVTPLTKVEQEMCNGALGYWYWDKGKGYQIARLRPLTPLEELL